METRPTTVLRRGGSVDVGASSGGPGEGCRSADCLALESLLRISLSATADPCTDFYDFVCGASSKLRPHQEEGIAAVLAANRLPDTRTAWARRRRARWTRTLYASCVRFCSRPERELVVARQFMRSLSLDLAAVSDDPREDPLDRMVQLSLRYSLPIILSVVVEDRVRIRGRPVLQLSLNNDDFLWFKLVSETHRPQLRNYYKSVLRIHGLHPNGTTARKFREIVIPLEKRVAGFITGDIRSNVSNIFSAVVTSIMKLADFTPGTVSGVRWARIVKDRSGGRFGASDAAVASPSTLRLVDFLARTASATDVRRLLGARLFAALFRGTGIESQTLASMGRSGHGTKGEDQCIRRITRFIDMPISGAYASPAKDDVGTMTERIRAALAREAQWRGLFQGRWLQTATRNLLDVRVVVGFNMGNESLDLAYKTIRDAVIGSGGFFVRVWLAASLAAQQRRLALSWSRAAEAPSVVSSANEAVYSDNVRTIVLPAALVQAPLFFARGLKSYNYGSLGQVRRPPLAQVIGQELFHVFSQPVVERPPNSDLFTAWGARITPSFRRKLSCFVQFYEKVTGGSAGPGQVYALLADLAGLRAARAALFSLPILERSGLPGLQLTDDRLFFVGHCALHCALVRMRPEDGTARDRCNLPLMLTAEFGSAFGCERGSPMSPVVKCDL